MDNVSRSLSYFLVLVFVLCLIGGYYLSYEPYRIIDGIKIYSENFVHSDHRTYLQWFEREVQHLEFYTWSLKFSTSLMGLIYFSALIGWMKSLPIYDFLISSFLIIASYVLFLKVLRAHKQHPKYLQFSFLGYFPLILFSQTITKEVIGIFLFSVIFWSFEKKNWPLLFMAVLFFFPIRAYNALIIMVAISAYFFGRIVKSKKFIVFTLICGSTFLSIIYERVFYNFYQSQGIILGTGLTHYFLQIMKIPILSLTMIPLRILQNLAEPIINLKNVQIETVVFQPLVLFEVMCTVLIIILGMILLMRLHKILWDDRTVLFSGLFLAAFLCVLGILPLVHFRYLAILFPVLGFFLDLCDDRSKEQQS
jgi:hypothetical protein